MTPLSLAPPEFYRASHLCECPTCGKLYIAHPYKSFGADYGCSADMPLILYRLCNGDWVKL